MKLKNKSIIVFALLLLFDCTTAENNLNIEEEVETILEEKEETVEVNTLPSCSEIEKYPVLFSFATDDLREELLAKIQQPLSTLQKEALFKFDNKNKYLPYGIFSPDFDVFAVNKISYETVTLVVYLVIEPQTEYYNEDDQIALVLYDKNGIPTDIISKVLVDVYGSTYEIKFSSPNEFSLINIDYEYSPDPESEAKDIASGRIIEPSYMVAKFKVDGLKFVEK